jgi:hypothetical protein
MSVAQPGVVAPWRATYAPGDWYVIAGPTSLVVLAPGAGRGEMIADLWSDVVASASMSDLVDRLAGYGITELPDLAVVFWSAVGMRTLVRGGVRLVDPGSGRQVAAGEGVITWSEVDLDELRNVRIRMLEQAASGGALPLAVGVVRAGEVTLSAEAGAAVRSPQPLLRSAAGAVAGAVEPSEAARSDRPAEPHETEPEMAAVPATATEPSTRPDRPETTEPTEVIADDESGPDFPPVETDTEAVGAVGAVGSPGAAVGGRAFGVVTPEEFSLEQFEMEHDDTQLMSSPVPVGSDGQVGAGGQRQGPGGSTQTRPMVEAVRCPNGHANAPGSTSCRVCRSPITARPPELIPEPLLARLRAADGTVVDLDRPVLLGRAPSEQRSTLPLPRLVSLASPAQDISRTHLQVVPDNWQVLVTDLNSTNGTFVTDPGPAGNRGLLPPGQPTPVPIGAVLELGEGVTVTVEAAD